MAEQRYETGIGDFAELLCARCNAALEVLPVSLSYLGHGFPVELPACPKCGAVYVPEELAEGKILHVETELEDK